MVCLANVGVGTTISGTFHCRKSDENSRELDVEFHYHVTPNGATPQGDPIIQFFKVN